MKSMKKLVVFFLLIAIVLFLSIFCLRDKIRHDFAASLPYPTNAPTPTGISYSGNSKETLSLFVPYWSVRANPNYDTNYNSLVFFGIAPTTKGLDMKEPGAKALN